ncbi:MAG TPA: winged helix DNA-binding domain-containing protein [Candidatus Dormibacteraeota bacterium]|jgi:hypothetical protein|nr:winged helix DNA-binding domain-containing protein [Candidatus Dormibacteraeota bacterium]
MRLDGHLLSDATRASTSRVDDVVRAVCGLQAQDRRAYPLSVRARSTGLTADDVVRARVDDRTVVRNWFMRGTLHLVASDDAVWLLPLLGPVLVRMAATRRAQLGLTDDIYARALHVIRSALASQGPLRRSQIAELLRSAGIDSSEQRNIFVLNRAASEGVICHGPPAGGDSAFALTSDWLGTRWPPQLLTADSPQRDALLTELARRYLTAHAPAEPRDFATWSGLPVSDARRAWRSLATELAEVRLRGQPAWILATQHDRAAAELAAHPGAPSVRLVPIFDGYLLGHRTRDLTVPDDHARRILPGGGWLNATVLADGVGVAGWTTTHTSDAMHITVTPFDHWDPSLDAAVDAEVADMARFLGTSATWDVSARA